ncbi:MAG TPA: hypothetical protein H9876_02050 [Candidatus Limosilactobacillus merdipullorum]|uniref:Uncharacterized protein n=1 Tax=Candidatus Limosilactobacillus merdipullorum TaxID=2838653 RepID=A0A9D1U4A4_9LACO|nr:hypothetical protein [Candidatus Limosilactobacillus merdipullorum]
MGWLPTSTRSVVALNGLILAIGGYRRSSSHCCWC